jgi:hypothetical protein
MTPTPTNYATRKILYLGTAAILSLLAAIQCGRTVHATVVALGTVRGVQCTLSTAFGIRR